MNTKLHAVAAVDGRPIRFGFALSAAFVGIPCRCLMRALLTPIPIRYPDAELPLELLSLSPIRLPLILEGHEAGIYERFNDSFICPERGLQPSGEGGFNSPHAGGFRNFVCCKINCNSLQKWLSRYKQHANFARL